MDPDSIVEIVSTIYKDKSKNKKAKFQDEYADFAKDHPVLFEMACSADFDFERFNHMINLKKSIDEGKMTQHDASVKVGGLLYNEYVKDKITHPKQ